MKKLIYLFALIFTVPVFAQTTVTGTIIDTSGQTWGMSTVTAALVNPHGGTVVYNATRQPVPNNVVATANSSGVFSVTVADVNQVSPTGVRWQLVICPASTSGCFTTPTFAATGSTYSANAFLTNIPAPHIIPGSTATAYSDAQISSSYLLPGATYFNLTNGVQRIYNGSSWANAGGSSSVGSPGSVQVAASGNLFAAATVPQIGAAITDSQLNSYLGTTLPTSWPFTTGFSDNILIGQNAGLNLSNGTSLTPTSGAVFIGVGAGEASKTNNGSVYIGNNAGQQVVGSNTGGEDTNSVCIGPNACTGVQQMYETVAIGNKAMIGNSNSNQNSSVFIGTHTSWTGSSTNTIVGGNIGWNQGGGATTPEQGTGNTIIGGGTFNPGVTGTVGVANDNTFVGIGACTSCFNSDSQIVIGNSSTGALGTTSSTSPLDNIIIGTNSGANLGSTVSSPTYNILIGDNSMPNNGYPATSSFTNVFCIGHNTCNNQYGSSSIFLGNNTGSGVLGVGSPTSDIVIGQNAGVGDTDLNSTVLIGNNATDNNNYYNNDVVIGQNAALSTLSTNSGQNVVIGNGAICNGCYGDEVIGYGASITPYQNVPVPGAVQIGAGTNVSPNTMQFQGYNFLSSNGNGRFTAINSSGAVTAVDVYASGAMTAPTMASGNNTTNVATTAFVQSAISAIPTSTTIYHGSATGCTTGSSTYSTCETAITWNATMPNVPSAVICTGHNASDPRAAILDTSSTTTTGTNVGTVTEGSVAVSYGTIYCVATP